MKKRFLIVDDDKLSCKILEDFMSEFAACDTAENGTVGYALFEKAILDGHPYDLICSDVLMPELGGHEFVRRVRDREASLPIVDCVRTRIFIISASGSPQDMTHALLDNNCDDYIVKPFQRETLRALLQKYELVEYHNEP